MPFPFLRPLVRTALVAALTAAAGAAPAQTAPKPAAKPEAGKPAGKGAFAGLGSSSKEPVKIDADRLEVFDREGRAVYSGNVVAVQGDTTMRCTNLTIFFERNRGQRGTQPAPASGDQNDAIQRIECAGPVTVLSKDQVATGDNAVYERAAARVVMTGNVALSQGPNVARGDRLVYDIDAGEARVEAAAAAPGAAGGPPKRVQSIFVPGSQPEGAAKPKPAAAPTR